eukprot:TRINITY_DN67802_c4_g2_i13.p1 TRINITY_DN67802_c4_g2~~TRINITY_DN67802_c4_g2_i13.p1  ORF type:complete len:297 (-),score=30.69 TRINITY_DN67802_c4_g2_i13:179-961(-)
MNEHNLAVNGHKRVSLCVGGQIFDTTEETLLKEKETFFWAMLRSGQWQPDDKDSGRYFINRSPQKFSVILDYLRDGEVWNWDRFSVDETNKLREEFDFYQVPFPGAKPLIYWNTTKPHPSMNISSTTVSISTPTDGTRNIYSTPFPVDCKQTTFLLRTTRLKPAGSVFFGKYGITLSGGRFSKNEGTDWEDFLPKLEFPGGLVVHEIKFDVSLLGDDSSVSVTWPTGDSKTIQLPCQPTELELAINKTVDCGLFELKHLI